MAKSTRGKETLLTEANYTFSVSGSIHERNTQEMLHGIGSETTAFTG